MHSTIFHVMLLCHLKSTFLFDVLQVLESDKMADMQEGTVRGDPRMEFLSEYTLRALRLKPDKWTRMLVSDEQRNFVNKFIDCYKPQVQS